MERLYTSKTFSKMADERMHAPHLIPLDLPLAIGYKNHQICKSGIPYFSYLAPLVLFFFNKRRSQKGRTGVGGWHNAPPP